MTKVSYCMYAQESLKHFRTDNKMSDQRAQDWLRRKVEEKKEEEKKEEEKKKKEEKKEDDKFLKKVQPGSSYVAMGSAAAAVGEVHEDKR